MFEKMKAKPDCTGQRFGMLVVLGKGSKQLYKNSYRQLWQLQCDCGKVIEIPRGYFEHNGQLSCGCKRKRGLVDNNRRPLDINGQRFGSLQAIALTGKKDNDGKPTWHFQCDCGNTREMSLSAIRRCENGHIRINCGDESKHPEKWLIYPPTPTPYPKEAGELLIKYLPLTKLNYQQIDSQVEDERLDRLIRAAWIITYRRMRGEDISPLYESRFIRKHLRYCSIDVFWKRTVEHQGGLVYDVSNRKKEIGSTMTNLTSNDYPAIETQGNIFTPENILTSETQGKIMLPTKRVRFKRR